MVNGVSGMDMLMSQMTGMAMMKENVNIQSLLWTMFVVLFLQKLLAHMPAFFEGVQKRVEAYFVQKTNSLVPTIDKADSVSITSSIIFTRNYHKAGTTTCRDYIIADAILDLACRNDNSQYLRSNGQYYIDHPREIPLGDEIFFKQLSTKLGEENTISEIILQIYSYSLTLTDLRRRIEKIYEDYQAEIQNELGEKLYYFEDIPQPLPKSIEGELRYETAPKTLIYRMNPFYTSKRLNNVYGNAMKIVRSRVRFFLENRGWYDSKGIPYTLGLLLHGPPGCGKTSLIKAIANECNRHVFSVRLSEHNTRSQLTNLFFNETIQENSNGRMRNLSIPMKRRLLVFEDIDTMSSAVKRRTQGVTKITNTDEEPKATLNLELDEDEQMTSIDDVLKQSVMLNLKLSTDAKAASEYVRKLQTTANKYIDKQPMFQTMGGLRAANDNRVIYDQPQNDSGMTEMLAPSEKLDLGTMLNLLDGILETPGRIMIMTSNHPEVLDPALIRPGRIDMIVHFDNCKKLEIKEIFKGLTDKEIPDKLLDSIPEKTYSPARITQAIFENFDNPEAGIAKLAPEI